MKLELSPGCLAWMEAVPPYAMYRTDLDFFEFISKDVQHYQRTVSPGLDVCIEFDPQNQDISDGPVIGFNLWGGASCVMVGKTDNIFPTTLGAFVCELRRFDKERFTIDNSFGTYAAILDPLIEKYSSLPVLVAGLPADT